MEEFQQISEKKKYMRKWQEVKWRKKIENEAQPEGINYNKEYKLQKNKLKLVEKKNFT